jgi:hypothetical protein
MRSFVRRSCNEPATSVIELYNNGAQELLKDFTFQMMIPLAMSLSLTYIESDASVSLSRELQVLIYDMHCKGYSEHEMCIICVIAASSRTTLRTSTMLFAKLVKLIESQIKFHGYTMVPLDDVAFVKETKSHLDHPQPPIINN